MGIVVGLTENGGHENDGPNLQGIIAKPNNTEHCSSYNSHSYFKVTMNSFCAFVCDFYRAMHFSTNARSWDRMSSV